LPSGATTEALPFPSWRCDIGAIAAAIRRYLQAHPNAFDTVDGIAQWWLPAVRVEASPAAVAAALDELVAAGDVEKRALASGETVYGVRRAPPP
jgi:hypothetical protein